MKKVDKLASEIREFINELNSNVGEVACEIENIVNKHAPIEKPFPKVMLTGASGGLLIYFIEKKKGYTLNNYNGWRKGTYNEEWEMEDFKDCEIQAKP